MKRFLLLILCFLSLVPFSFGVDKEVIQLQQNVALLQGMVRELQRSFDEKMAIMQTLVGQTNEKLNQTAQTNGQLNSQLGTGLAELQKSVQNSVANTGQKVDNLTTQMQALQSSMDELRARLDNVSAQVQKLVSNSQSIPTGASGPGAATAPGFPGTGFPTGSPDAGPGPSQPTPDVLYNSGLRDYTSGNYPLALQEFNDYLRFYPNTALASNAQYYVGDVYYQQGQFSRAIQEYDKAIEQYPNGNKTAAAQLKKGYALLNMDERAQGSRELNNLIKRFPNSPEASLAKEKLANLGPERPATRTKRKTALR